MKNNNAILIKSKSFAVRCVKLYQYLQSEKHEYTMSLQLLRSGTSIGANIKESIYAQSRADFVSKMSIALKEAAETEYWIELLSETGYINEKQFNSIYADNREIIRMLISIIRTLKNS